MKHFTVAEAATYLRLTPGAVRQAVRRKHLAKGREIDGRTYELEGKSVEAYKHRQEQRRK